MKVNIINDHLGELRFGDKCYPCALGKSGVTANKREGDHCSPAGVYSLRSLYYRADKIKKPVSKLELSAISKKDGWCDDPAISAYNQRVELPFNGSYETLWREDDLYDIVVVIGHNDTPPVSGFGSCIFMHVAKPNFEGTEGCVALKLSDLLALLSAIEKETKIEILG
ncbi:MAG: L,D-transpeptidase family protein [Sneathiella sp.]